MSKVKISELLSCYFPHAVMTEGAAPPNPPASQWGYTLGGDGRIATLDYLTARAKKEYPDSWEDYLSRTKKWLGRVVQDCNAVAEAFYKQITGVDINTKARLNYANWCNPKSGQKADKTLAGLPQQPGVAVFIGPSADSIAHVGFLLYKYGTGPLDWYVLESRGADYGLVITKLAGRGWAWWGVMSKYFEYDVGAAWQPGKPAESSPQPAEPAPAPATNSPAFSTCTGGSVNVRSGPGTTYGVVAVAHAGDKLVVLPAADGWRQIAGIIDGKPVTGYISDKYVKEV